MSTISVNLSDQFYWLKKFGLRTGSPYAGMTRVELLGEREQWEQALSCLREHRETQRGANKTSVTRAIQRIEFMVENDKRRSGV